MKPRSRLPSLLALVLLAAACRAGGPSAGRSPQPGPTGSQSASPPPGSPTPSPSPSPSPSPAAPRLDDVRVALTQVASMAQPLAMALAPGDDALWVAEKTGRVRAIRGGQPGAPLLDLSGEISTGSEQGLLGLAFAPGGGYLYVNFTDRSGDTHVREYAFAGGRVETGSAREVLFVDQPFSNHNGGNLVFGPDRRLWIGLGDGGSAGDPNDNAQNLGRLLGKMLRIDPRPDGGRPYGIPPDNPFVAREGGRGEIWAYGLRNPWRYSFDRATGDLWIGDVGQNRFEEVDFQPASSRGGENYGWSRLEATHPFKGQAPPEAVPPVLEYPLGGGNCAVSGGYVYRGSRIPSLAGAYVFADFCVGRLRAIVLTGGQVTADRFLGPEVRNLASFGQDAAGELYALSLSGAVFRLDPQ